MDKLAYLGKAQLDGIGFGEIMPDKRNDWLNQSNSNFEGLLPLANKQTKFAKATDDEQAIFRLFSNGVKTNRDEWVFDFDGRNLAKKVTHFVAAYEEQRSQLGARKYADSDLRTDIKWDGTLVSYLRKDIPIQYASSCIVPALYRPFTKKSLYFLRELNNSQYQMPRIFPSGRSGQNKVIAFSGVASNKPFSVLATDRVYSLDLLEKTQCLPLYRYTEDGERVSNITDWGLRRINAHYRKEFGEHFEEVVGADAINAEDIFAYTYAVLHDPVYRHDYRVDLLREFPRLPLYHDFAAWREMGRELLDLHIGFESAEPYPLERVDTGTGRIVDSRLRGNDGLRLGNDSGTVREGDRVSPRVMLRANAKDKERGEIHIDSDTTLRGVPADAWRYRLGSRSALEWVLDQYKEKKPRDPTIAAKFNTYRFADYKEQVIDLLRRVCTVSVRTMDVVDDMAYWENGELTVFGDRDKFEMAMVSMSQWFEKPEDEEWLTEWDALPDIRAMKEDE